MTEYRETMMFRAHSACSQHELGKTFKLKTMKEPPRASLAGVAVK